MMTDDVTELDTSCPVCGDEDYEDIGGVLRCANCGSYYSPEEDYEVRWERAALHKTKLRPTDE